MPGIELHHAASDCTRGSATITFQSSNWKLACRALAQAASMSAAPATRAASATPGRYMEYLLEECGSRPPAIGRVEQHDRDARAFALGERTRHLPACRE